jgi:hypothetical protein
MKHTSLWVGICAASLLAACVTQTVSVPPVGPGPAAASGNELGTGRLAVYSAWSVLDNYLQRNHSGYTIYSANGDKVKWVSNGVEGDYNVTTPPSINLPAGRYNVRAQAGQYGWITVPTVIRAGQTTIIYLDGERHPIDSFAGQKNVVKLPNGEVIGWAAARG